MFRKIRNTIKSYKLSNFNFRLLIYVISITVIGILCIGSATEGENFQTKQIVGMALGLIAILVLSFISYKLIFQVLLGHIPCYMYPASFGTGSWYCK